MPKRLKEYVPPSWHNGWCDNSHLIEYDAETETFTPKPEYQAYADETNLEMVRLKINVQLVWNSGSGHFDRRPIVEE